MLLKESSDYQEHQQEQSLHSIIQNQNNGCYGSMLSFIFTRLSVFLSTYTMIIMSKACLATMIMVG